MKWILYTASLLWIACGTATILYTTRWRDLIRALYDKKRQRVLGAIETAGGLLLLLAASASRIPWAISILGITAMAEGMIFLFNPRDVSEKLTTWYVETLSDQAQRLVGIISLVLGTAVLSWIR